MAELEGLYFGMGIDTSQLHSDFVDAEKTINQNLARLNKEMKLIQLHGQIELEGLDESAANAEKLRIQEEALTAQMALQQDKIVMLSAVYEHLSKTKGSNAEVTKKVEMQLAGEQLAMQRLEQQMKDLSKQTEIAFGIQLEMLGLIEPAIKAIDSAVAAGHTLPIPVPYAKAAAAASIGLLSVAEGSREATEELREENPAKVLDEEFQKAAVGIDDSWQKINASTQRGYSQMQSYNNGYQNYRHNQYSNRRSELSEFKKEVHETGTEIEKLAKAEDGLLEKFAKAIGVSSDEDGLKILPSPNRNDILRLAKVAENYRFSEGLNSAMDLLKESDSVIGKLAATFLNFWYVTSNIPQPITEFAQVAIDNFRELSKAAAELNLPLERTNDLLATINLSGAEYNDIRDFVRGVQDAVIKGDSEDPEVLALEKYDVVIQDTNGKLLAFDETLDRLYQGYLKARDAGEAEAYVMMTNGQAVQDVLPYFERLEQAKEDVAKIKWSTLDSATLKNVSHEMKLVETQAGELTNAISGALAPAAEMALKNMFEDQKALTEVIEENREKIIYWSYAFMEAINAFKEVRIGAKDNLLQAFESLKSLNEEFGLTDKLKSFFADEPKKDIGEEAKEYFIPFYEELKKIEEEFQVISRLECFLPEGFTSELDNAIQGYLVPFYEKIKSIKEEFSITNKLKSAVSDFLPDELLSLPDVLFGEDSIFARAQKDLEEYKKANEEARKEAKKTEEYLAGLSYSNNRIRNYGYELRNLKLDIEFGSGDNYQKQIEQNKIWYDKSMQDAKLYANEQAIIAQVNAARLEKIELEKEQRLDEIRDQIAAADKTALENKLDNIEKERQAWLKAGMDEAEATELAEQQKLKARQEAAEKAQQYIKDAADIEYSLTHSAYEKQLRDIAQWKDAQLKKAETAEEVAGIIKNAAAKEAQAFENEVDRIKGKIQTLEDKIFEQEHSSYDNDVRKLQQERYQLYQEGIYSQELIERYYQNALTKLDQRAAKDTDYAKDPEGMRRGDLTNLFTDESKIRAQLAQQMQRAQTQPQSQPQPPIANETFKNLATSAQSAAEAQKTFADNLNNLPPDYFKQLADQAKAVATMQGNLTQSTIDLIDAQGKLSKSLATFPKAEKQSPVKETSQAIASTTKARSAETESQRALRQALSKLPDAVKSFQSPSTDRQLPTKDFSQLADSTQDVRQAQDLLARTAAETRTSLENIKYPEQTQITPKDSGIKFGFDYDTAKDIFLTGAGMAAASAGTGVGLALSPEILAGAIVAAGVGGFVKGSYDETTAKPESTERPQPLSEIDLSGVITPLTSIDSNLQSVLQTLQDQSIDTADEQPYQADALQELFGELPNIRADVQSIFQELQARGEVESPVQTAESIGQDYLPTLINIDGNLQSVLTELQAQSTQETTMTFETIVTPLNNIAGLVQQVLSALSNRQPAQINVSPTNSINLGGAYVFDNAMKKSLVDDITSQIVSAITSAVQQATSQSNYSYGA